jgi:two-component system, OmpR family, KDP operon response regulator KdpE
LAEPSVLIIDDDPALLRVLGAGLEARGYAVRSAATGVDALEEAGVGEIDVVILDLGLPDIDGIDMCVHLRHRTPAPIVVLSADGAEHRKIGALDSGAADYLTKPFSMPELLARLRVALRHGRAMAALVEDDLIQVGLLRIDLGARQAMVVDHVLDLTAKEFALLTLLARNPGRVLTHQRILEQVWEPDQSLNTLRTHVSQLRRKLGDSPLTPKVVTAPGVGYQLLAEAPNEVRGT